MNDLSKLEPEGSEKVLLEKRVQALLELLDPKSELLTIELCAGSYSNFTYLVEARTEADAILRVVVRLYAVFGSYDRGEKARREFRTLLLLTRHGLLVPPPLYLDDTGSVLGVPGIVTIYVPGAQIESPSDPEGWACSLATTLAAIHSVPCPDTSFLLNADAEATWFIRGEGVPDFMAAHPEGREVWRVARDLWPSLQRVPPTLVHLDYWPGNVLWEREEVSAVVDWEEAAYGDPGIDVAYCRMDMFLRGLHDAADVFLDVYEAKVGRRVASLGFWQLAAAARPLFSPTGWISDSPAKERFADFIVDAKGRA